MWNKTNGIGFLFVLCLTLLSIDDMLDWVWHLSYPKWMNVICSVFVFILWFLGLIFLYEAEKAMKTKRKK